MNDNALKPKTLDEMWTKVKALTSRAAKLEEKLAEIDRKLADAHIN